MKEVIIGGKYLKSILEQAKEWYNLSGFDCNGVFEHEGGRNKVYVCSQNGEKKYALRVSSLGDRTEEEYLAEVEFVWYLAEHKAPVADVVPSVQGNLVECAEQDGEKIYIEPYIDSAKIKVNSSMEIEPMFFKDILGKMLSEISEDSEYYSFGKGLLDKISLFCGADAKFLPKDSLLREFVG